MDWLGFECTVMDLADEEKIENSEQLQYFADLLHQHIEIAMSDYASDHDFEEYEQMY